MFSSSARRILFRTLAASIVPETAAATSDQWRELEATIERTLSGRPPRVRRQLGFFLRLLAVLARVRYGSALVRLDPVRRQALLQSLAGSPFLLLRRGVWGLRTLVLLGWYTQPAVARGLGYRAAPSGWSRPR